MRRNVHSTCDTPLPADKKYIAVNLLTLETLYFVVDAKSRVNELFAQICGHLALNEPSLFGVCVDSECSKGFIFLDPSYKLYKYAPKQWKLSNSGVDSTGKCLFGVHFRVQFYVDSYLFISDRVAKLHYYLQLRENVVNYSQSLYEDRAFLLASYALQADEGDFNPQIHVDQYFNPRLYFPSWVIEEMGTDYIVKHCPFLHREHKGMRQLEAQSMFIKEASDASAPHNLHLYCLRNKKTSSDVWLGICANGIEINAEEERVSSCSDARMAKRKSRLSFFAWPDIGKLYFEKKKFEICSTGYPVRKFTYHAKSEDMARHLLFLCKASHQFQLVMQSKMVEVKRRESELSRKKFRESYIYSAAFELPLINRNKNERQSSDSPSESVCDETGTQRVSVISNASSNTTSGIVSDKMQSLDDSDRDDIDIELMAKSAPIVSLESLALSEPTGSTCDSHSTAMPSKQHSISISNINTTKSNCITECNHFTDCKMRTDINDSSSANSIKSTSSEQSNVTIKSVIVTNVYAMPNGHIINISNKSGDNAVNSYSVVNNNTHHIESTVNTSLIHDKRSSNFSAKVGHHSNAEVQNVSQTSPDSVNHIYENIPYFSQLQKCNAKPKQILNACPSLLSTYAITPQRNATRIGVSSLTRAHLKPTLSVFNDKCTANAKTHLSVAGSEPNLCNSKLWSIPSSSLKSRAGLELSINGVNNSSLTASSLDCITHNCAEKTNVLKVAKPFDRKVMIDSAKEMRSHSDPQYHYSCATPVRQCSSQSPRTALQLKCSQCTPTSFHQSLNDIANNPNGHPLRLVGSDMNVSAPYSLRTIPPPPDYGNSLSLNGITKCANNSPLKTSHKENNYINNANVNGFANVKSERDGSISDLHQLRQKSRDLDIPLIRALFNDRSLMVPKTVPCSRQRHMSTARDIRRYSCCPEIYSDTSKLAVSAAMLSSETPLRRESRPTTWHLEYPQTQQQMQLWEHFHSEVEYPQLQYRNPTEFIERLWAEHHLTT